MDPAENTLLPVPAIASDIRLRIQEGAYPCGSQLPTRVELREHYGTTLATLDRVFRRLASEGIVVTAGRRGTFVATSPPHLSTYALVFPYRDRRSRPWPWFWRALADAMATHADRHGHTLKQCFGNETHQDLDAYAELIQDVTAHRLAGLIFATPPFYLAGSPVLDTPGVPRVALSNRTGRSHVKCVTMAGDFFGEAIRRLLAAGHRRIASVTAPVQMETAAKALHDQGVDAPPYWVQSSSVDAPAGARRAVQLLMALPRAKRPNALIISDDNLVPEATAGLVDAAVQVPQDVMVVAHTNFPEPTVSKVPALRLGYDVRTILTTCIDVLDRERRGKRVPTQSTVPLVDASDVEHQDAQTCPLGRTATQTAHSSNRRLRH